MYEVTIDECITIRNADVYTNSTGIKDKWVRIVSRDTDIVIEGSCDFVEYPIGGIVEVWGMFQEKAELEPWQTSYANDLGYPYLHYRDSGDIIYDMPDAQAYKKLYDRTNLSNFSKVKITYATPNTDTSNVDNYLRETMPSVEPYTIGTGYVSGADFVGKATSPYTISVSGLRVDLNQDERIAAKEQKLTELLKAIDKARYDTTFSDLFHNPRTQPNYDSKLWDVMTDEDVEF